MVSHIDSGGARQACEAKPGRQPPTGQGAQDRHRAAGWGRESAAEPQRGRGEGEKGGSVQNVGGGFSAINCRIIKTSVSPSMCAAKAKAIAH